MNRIISHLGNYDHLKVSNKSTEKDPLEAGGFRQYFSLNEIDGNYCILYKPQSRKLELYYLPPKDSVPEDFVKTLCSLLPGKINYWSTKGKDVAGPHIWLNISREDLVRIEAFNPENIEKSL